MNERSLLINKAQSDSMHRARSLSLVLRSAFLSLQTQCSPYELQDGIKRSVLIGAVNAMFGFIHVEITIECQGLLCERAGVCGLCTECGGSAVHVENRGRPASPGRGAGPPDWFLAVGRVNCCNVLPFAGLKSGLVDLPLLQLVLAHLNSLQGRIAPLLAGKELCLSSFCALKSECSGSHRLQQTAEVSLHHAPAPPPGNLDS